MVRSSGWATLKIINCHTAGGALQRYYFKTGKVASNRAGSRGREEADRRLSLRRPASMAHVEAARILLGARADAGVGWRFTALLIDLEDRSLSEMPDEATRSLMEARDGWWIE